MPIDKDLTIHPQKKEKKFKFSIKDICLVITTGISIIMPIVAVTEINNQKLQYELEKANYENAVYELELERSNYENDVQRLELERSNYENDVQRLEIEKNNYENMLKENNIQLRSSYIVCNIDYIGMLFDNLESESNVKILANSITDIFYDEEEKKYLHTQEIQNRDINLKNRYENNLNAEVYFLKIEVISNRIVKDVEIDFKKIETENYIEGGFVNFEYLRYKECYESSQDISIQVGDVKPNDIILIPVVLEYSNYNALIDYNLSDIDAGYIVYNNDGLMYKEIYVPKTIICYDEFYEKQKVFNIRDVLDDNLLTSFYYEEKG